MATPATYPPARQSPRGSVTRWVVGLSAVAVVAGVVGLGARRRAAPPPVVRAPATATAASAKENVAAVPPASPVPIAPLPDAAVVPPRSNTSEQSADRPIKRPAPRKLGSRTAKKASARDDKPAEPETPADHRPIDIERDNPYGR